LKLFKCLASELVFLSFAVLKGGETEPEGGVYYFSDERAERRESEFNQVSGQRIKITSGRL